MPCLVHPQNSDGVVAARSTETDGYQQADIRTDEQPDIRDGQYIEKCSTTLYRHDFLKTEKS